VFGSRTYTHTHTHEHTHTPTHILTVNTNCYYFTPKTHVTKSRGKGLRKAGASIVLLYVVYTMAKINITMFQDGLRMPLLNANNT
jgi:hypothetical protein